MKSRQKGLQVLESVGIRPTLCVGDVVAVRITSRSRCVPHVVIRALGFVNVFKSQFNNPFNNVFNNAFNY